MTMRLFLAAALLSLLSACDFASQAAMAGFNLVSYVHTDKTLTDHAISFITEENCSIRHSANNQPYCQPLPEADLAAGGGSNAPYNDPNSLGDSEIASAPSVFCYRTLGKISCYSEPDPTASSYAAMQ